jgi:hypothetical protein
MFGERFFKHNLLAKIFLISNNKPEKELAVSVKPHECYRSKALEMIENQTFSTSHNRNILYLLLNANNDESSKFGMGEKEKLLSNIMLTTENSELSDFIQQALSKKELSDDLFKKVYEMLPEDE